MTHGTEPPMRQLTRLRTELSIASHQLINTVLDGQAMLGAELGVVARVCVPDWTQGGVLARPAAPTRWITVRRMALSLNNAPESTRRRVNALIDLGLLVASRQGVALSVAPEREATLIAYLQLNHDMFVRLIEDVSKTCDLDLAIARVPAFGPQDVIERSLDTLLQSIDTFRPEGASGVAFLIWGALTAVAVREVTYDPVLSRRFANAIPTDDVRSGISLRRLAAGLGIPYATAWRAMQGLEANGLVTRLGADQWTVLTANLMTDSVRDISRQPSLRLLGKLRELAQLGLDPAMAGSLYLAGRTPPADFGSVA